MNLLFVCTANLLRSPTAAKYFNGRNQHVARSAGIMASPPCHQITEEDVRWAHKIFCMESNHARYLERNFTRLPSLYVLNIPDIYEFDQPELVALLTRRVYPKL